MIPQHIGPATPAQTVQIRFGHFSRREAEGGGHQPWDEVNYKCSARVGNVKVNPFYTTPWQATWVPLTSYVTIPGVSEVKLDKALEIGGVGTASVQIENILYALQAGDYHTRERGAMAPLYGLMAAASEAGPDIAALAASWLASLEEGFTPNEWEGRFAFAAQLTIHQGYGTALAKTFTGLIEDVDGTSQPDRLTVTCRDFGQLFTDTHFFGWGKDPEIDTPVTFTDIELSLKNSLQGYNAHASDEDKPSHTAPKVTDSNSKTWWQTNVVHSNEQTEYVEIALPEGVYTWADLIPKWVGMDCYVALRPSKLTGGLDPTREEAGKGAEDMDAANHWLDAEGWIDPSKKEEQKVPGVEGGNSYIELHKAYGGGEKVPLWLDKEGNPIAIRVGKNSRLRVSFRKLHKVESGENFRAGMTTLMGLHEAEEPGQARAHWVMTQDISDVIKIICQWAGFKEWDIEKVNARLPVPIIAWQNESYLDIIKKVCEGIGFIFFIADPESDESKGGGGVESLGVPTFRKTKVTSNDAGEELPVITDQNLLTAIDVKQSNEPLSTAIRVFGITKSVPGNMELAERSGKRIVYSFWPPWSGTPGDNYRDSRLGGVLKDLVHKNPLFATVDLCRNAAWFIGLQQALQSISATIEIPGFPGLDLDDHALLFDQGTGVASRLAVKQRSSTFTDGEKRKYVTSLTGPLIDTPDVRDMVNIISADGEFPYEDNGAGGLWVNPKEGIPSSLGYG